MSHKMNIPPIQHTSNNGVPTIIHNPIYNIVIVQPPMLSTIHVAPRFQGSQRERIHEIPVVMNADCPHCGGEGHPYHQESNDSDSDNYYPPEMHYQDRPINLNPEAPVFTPTVNIDVSEMLRQQDQNR